MLLEKVERMVTQRHMKIAVCDDTRTFVSVFEAELKKYAAKEDLTLSILKFYLPEKLLDYDLADCDALFLDIEMPGITGIELAKQLRLKYPEIVIVFLTSFIEYAPVGYRVNAFRYLLKKSLTSELASCMDDVIEKLQGAGELLSFHTKDRTIEVPRKNILYFEGTAHRNVLLHLKQSDCPVECAGRLTDYDATLSDQGFLRIQNSFLVNMDNILKIKNYVAVLSDGTELKVSERKYAQVKKQFLMRKGKVL